jgi:hypothetical protein
MTMIGSAFVLDRQDYCATSDPMKERLSGGGYGRQRGMIQ